MPGHNTKTGAGDRDLCSLMHIRTCRPPGSWPHTHFLSSTGLASHRKPPGFLGCAHQEGARKDACAELGSSGVSGVHQPPACTARPSSPEEERTRLTKSLTLRTGPCRKSLTLDSGWQRTKSGWARGAKGELFPERPHPMAAWHRFAETVQAIAL